MKNPVYIGKIMKSNTKRPDLGKAAVEALHNIGFSMKQIRSILPKLTGTTLAQIGDKIGVSAATVAQTMKGRSGHMIVIRSISTAMGIPAEVLFPEKASRLKPRASDRDTPRAAL